MRPALDLLGEVGERLLTRCGFEPLRFGLTVLCILSLIVLVFLGHRFLSTEVGVEYLDEIDFIERELDEWFNVRPLSFPLRSRLLLTPSCSAQHRNLLYVVELELALASVFQTDGGLCTPSSVSLPRLFPLSLLSSLLNFAVLPLTARLQPISTASSSKRTEGARSSATVSTLTRLPT